MLYAPAECDQCGVVFGSGVVIAEHPGEPSSYRRTAGPCPQCGGRGSVPEWVFRFHATAAGARDQATPDEISSLSVALRRHLSSSEPKDLGDADTDLNAHLVGPWRPVAVVLHRSPADQRSAQLTLLLWMLDAP